MTKWSTNLFPIGVPDLAQKDQRDNHQADGGVGKRQREWVLQSIFVITTLDLLVVNRLTCSNVDGQNTTSQTHYLFKDK
jgi:hypothetical protein